MGRVKTRLDPNIDYSSYVYTNFEPLYKEENIIKYGCDGRCTGEDDHGGVVDKERKEIHDRVIRSVLTNIVLFRYIVKLSRSNFIRQHAANVISFNDKIIKRYNEINSVEWMVNSGYHNLLKEKMERGESLKWTPSAIGSICGLVKDPEIFDYIYNEKRILFAHPALLSAAVTNGNIMVYDKLIEQTYPVSLNGSPVITTWNLVSESISNGQYEMFLKLIQEEDITKRLKKKLPSTIVEESTEPKFISGIVSILTYLYNLIEETPSLHLSSYINNIYAVVLRTQNIELVKKFNPNIENVEVIRYIEELVLTDIVTKKTKDFIIELLQLYSQIDISKEIMELDKEYSHENYPLLSEKFINTWIVYCISTEFQKKNDEPMQQDWRSNIVTRLKLEMDRIATKLKSLENNNNQQPTTDIYELHQKFIMYLVNNNHAVYIFSLGDLEMVKYLFKTSNLETINRYHDEFKPASFEILSFVIENSNQVNIDLYLTEQLVIYVTEEGWVNALDLLYQTRPSLFTTSLFVGRWYTKFSLSVYEAIVKLVGYIKVQTNMDLVNVPVSIFGMFSGSIEVVKKICELSRDMMGSKYSPDRDDIDTVKYYCNELQKCSVYKGGTNSIKDLMGLLIKRSFYNSIDYIVNVSKLSNVLNIKDLLNNAYTSGDTKLQEILMKKAKFGEETSLLLASRGTIQELEYIIMNTDVEGADKVQNWITRMLSVATRSRRMDVFKYLWNKYEKVCIIGVNLEKLKIMASTMMIMNDAVFFKYFIYEFVPEFISKYQQHKMQEKEKQYHSQRLKRKVTEVNVEDDDVELSLDNFSLRKFRQSVFMEMLTLGNENQFCLECCKVLIGDNETWFITKAIINLLFARGSLSLVLYLRELNQNIPLTHKVNSSTAPIKYYITQQKKLPKKQKLKK